MVNHFDEIDDLKRYGRNAPLKITAKEIMGANDIVNKIYEIRTRKTRKIFFFVSSKLRAKQTFEVVANALTRRADNKGIDLEIKYSNNLAGQEQGIVNIPAGYVSGDNVPSFGVAREVFVKETYINKNAYYRFGDPLIDETGLVKYPELVGLFMEYGDTGYETLLRHLKSFLKIIRKTIKTSKNELVVVISHTLTTVIFQEIFEILEANEIPTNYPGDLLFSLWDIYIKKKEEISFDDIVLIQFDSKVVKIGIDLVQREIGVLEEILRLSNSTLGN